MSKSLIIACDGEAASGKSTGAKLLSKKYKLLLLNSGLLYRYASKILLTKRPKKPIPYLKKKFKKVSYNLIKKQSLHSQEISNHVGYLAKNKQIREIMRVYQKNIIKKNKRICVEGRDIATKILNKNPKYNLAFYFTCKINVAAKRRWKELKKKVPLKEVQKSLAKRTKMDKNRKHSPLKKVKDAILIRTDKINKKEVLNRMSREVNKII
tara:strand:- start:109 stop:738 length:630 start_codon:yes stop_codon:yes gene_type:complete